MTPASGVVAWRTGRAWSAFHLTGADLWKTLCGCAVPTKPLDTITRMRGRSKEPTCRSCLKALDLAASKRLELIK